MVKSCKIVKWKAVASWHWSNTTDENDLCGICQSHFEACCANCKIPGINCPIISGSCSHIFHSHCIVEWIQQQAAKSSEGPHCPMCRQIWEPKS